jgi:hypothetical protein
MQAWEELTQDAAPDASVAATADEAARKSAGQDTVAAVHAADNDHAAQHPSQPSVSAGQEGQDEQPAEGGAGKHPAKDAGDEPPEESTGDGAEPANFDKLISDEVKGLKDSKKRPFLPHDTGLRTCLFMHMPLVSPSTPGPREVCSPASPAPTPFTCTCLACRPVHQVLERLYSAHIDSAELLFTCCSSCFIADVTIPVCCNPCCTCTYVDCT